MFEPGRPYFITNRTIHGRLLMNPSPVINDLIGGIVGRALTLFDINLYALEILGNHPHMVLSAERPSEISSFMQWVQSNIARKVGQKVDWHDKFWARRFSAEPILDDDAMIDRLEYIFAHGAKEGLVDRAEQWPGLTSIPELVHGVRRLFHWEDETAKGLALRRGESFAADAFKTAYRIDYAPLPCWEGLSDTELRAKYAAALDRANERAREMRGEVQALGREGVLARDPHAKPKHFTRRPRPLCHTTSPALHEGFKLLYREFVVAYGIAAEALRSGATGPPFPDNAFRPPLPWNWSAIPA